MAAVTPGAVAMPCNSVPRLAQLIAENPDADVLIGDVHGRVDPLTSLLRALDLVDDDLSRRPRPGRLIQLGDLADGRNPEDDLALEFGENVFDVILCGNHEAALLGGPSFGGLVMVRPEVREPLERLARRGRLELAVRVGDMIASHAGISAAVAGEDTPDAVIARLDDLWTDFLIRRSRQPEALFKRDTHRGGTSAGGGVLWQDWRSLLDDPMPGVRQVVGHTPLAGPESDPKGQICAIDLAGDIGLAVVLADGSIHAGAAGA